MTSRTTGWASIVMALSIVSFIPITMVGYSGAGVDSTDFTDGALTRSLSALQLTGHLGGGIWLAIPAAAAVSTGAMGRALGRWGVVAGVVFAASVFGPKIL